MAQNPTSSLYNIWTNEEVKVLTDNYYNLGRSNEMQALLPRHPISSIIDKVSFLKLKHKRSWRNDEIEILKNNYSELGISKEMLSLLSQRSIKSVQIKASRLGLKLKRKPLDIRKKECSSKYYQNHKKEIIIQNQKYYQNHKENKKIYDKKYNLDNKEKINTRNRKYHWDHADEAIIKWNDKKLMVYEILSPNMCCVKCGETDIRVLQIDHINGGGTKARREGRATYDYYLSLPIEELKQNYQLLCANCNMIKRDECNECQREQNNDPIKLRKRELVKEKREERKVILFTRLSLGLCCVRCGFFDIHALVVDHKNGGGSRAIKEGKRYDYYLRLPITELREKHQLLCANCNEIKKHENNECKNRINFAKS